jgi:hypothetical protein
MDRSMMAEGAVVSGLAVKEKEMLGAIAEAYVASEVTAASIVQMPADTKATCPEAGPIVQTPVVKLE